MGAVLSNTTKPLQGSVLRNSGEDEFLLEGGHLRRTGFPFAMWPLQDVKALLADLKKIGTLVMVRNQFYAWISSSVPVISEGEVNELFGLLDSAYNGRVNCLEFLAAMVILSCEDLEAKTQFCFELYDLNLNGSLCRSEIVLMVRSTVLGSLKLVDLDPSKSVDVLDRDEIFEAIADQALAMYDRNFSRNLSFSEFASWARGNREVMRYIESFQIFARVAASELQLHMSGQFKADDISMKDKDQAISNNTMALVTQTAVGDESLPEDSTGDHQIPERAAASAMLLGSFEVDCQDCSTQLKREWAYAFSGQVGCKLAHYVDTKREKIVYAADSIIVVQNLCTQSQEFFLGHQDSVVSIAVDPSGSYVASSDLRGEVHIWSVAQVASDHATRAILQVRPGYMHLAFDATGQIIAIVSNSSKDRNNTSSVSTNHRVSIEFWDWAKQERLAEPIYLMQNEVQDIAWCHDSSLFAIAGNGFVKLIDAQLQAHDKFNGQRYNTRAGILSRLEVVDVELGEFTKTTSSAPCFTCLCFLGKTVVAGTEQGTILQFDCATAKLTQIVQAQLDYQAISCIAEWKLGVVSASRDGSLQLWDMGLHPLNTSSSANVKNQIVLNEGEICTLCLANSRNSKIALVGSSNGRLWEMNFGQKYDSGAVTKIPTVRSHAGEGAPLASVLPHSETTIITSSTSDLCLYVWDIVNQRILFSYALQAPPRCMAFSPQGDYFAIVLSTGVISLHEPFDSDHPFAEIHRFELPENQHAATDIAFSPDGAYLAVGCESTTVYLFMVRRQPLTKHKQFTCVQALKPSTNQSSYIDMGCRVLLDWSSESTILRTSVVSQMQYTSAQQFYWDISRAGALIEENLSAIRSLSWCGQVCPDLGDIKGIPPVLASKACAFAIYKNRLAVGTRDGKIFCVPFPCPKELPEDLVKVYSVSNKLSTPVSSIIFVDEGKRLLSMAPYGTIMQWTIEFDNESETSAMNTIVSSSPFIPSEDPEIAEELWKIQARAWQNIGSIEQLDGPFADVGGDSAMPEENYPPIDDSLARQDVLQLAMGLLPNRRDPDASLSWLQGYNVARNNIKYLADQRVAWPACGSVVINCFSSKQGKLDQSFVCPLNQSQNQSQHPDVPIEVLAISPQRLHLAFGQGSKLYVWDSESNSIVSSVEFPWSSAGAAHISFNTDGSRIAAVGADAHQTVAIVDWPKRRCVGFAPSGSPAILDIVWSDVCCFTTVGIRHVSFWNLANGGSGAPEVRRGLFSTSSGDRIQTQNVISVCALAKEQIVAGLADGRLAIWDIQSRKIVTLLGSEGNSCLTLCQSLRNQPGFFAGMKSGHLIYWSQDNGDPNSYTPHEIFHAASSIKCIDVTPKQSSRMGSLFHENLTGYQNDRISPGLVYCVIGDRVGGINEINIDLRTKQLEVQSSFKSLLKTHSKGESWALAAHPSEQIAFTAADDGYIRIWDLQARHELNTIKVAHKVISLAVAVSPEDDEADILAVGCDNGDVDIFQFKRSALSTDQFMPLAQSLRNGEDWCQALQFSPDARRLAIGCHDHNIYVYDMLNQEQTIKIQAHTSPVIKLDWSLDIIDQFSGASRYLQSMSSTREILYLEIPLVSDDPKLLRDTESIQGIEWATYTCLGGWAVSGIKSRHFWASCARSYGGMHLVAGDVDGSLKVLAFPSNLGLPTREVRLASLHAGILSQVAFSANDCYILSLDTRRCLCVWKTESLEDIASAKYKWMALEQDERDRRLQLARDQAENIRVNVSESKIPVSHAEDTATTVDQGISLKSTSSPTRSASVNFSTFKMHRLSWEIDNESWKSQLVPRILSKNPTLALGASKSSPQLHINWVYGRTKHIAARFCGSLDDYAFAAANIVVIQRPVRAGQLAKQTFFVDHQCEVVALDVSGDGQLMISADALQNVLVWSPSSLTQVANFKTDSSVKMIRFSPRATLAGLLLDTGSFALVCIKTGLVQCTGIFSEAGCASSCDLIVMPKNENDPNSDVDIAIAGGKYLKVWTFDPVRARLTSCTKESPVGSDFLCLALGDAGLLSGHADGALISWSGVSTNVRRILNQSNFKERGSIQQLSDISQITPLQTGGYVCLSRSGKTLLLDPMMAPDTPLLLKPGQSKICFLDSDRAGRKRILVSYANGAILEYDTLRQSLHEVQCGHHALKQGTIPEAEVLSQDTSARGIDVSLFLHEARSFMLSVGEDCYAKVWDVENHTVLTEQHLPDAATCCAVSQAGHHIAVGTRSGTLVVFSSMLRRQILQVAISFQQGSDHIRDGVRALQYSPDGSMLAVAGDDGHVRVLETRNYALIRHFPHVHQVPVTHMDWSVSGDFLRTNGCIQALPVSLVRKIVPKLTRNEYAELAVSTETKKDINSITWQTNSCAMSETTAHLHQSIRSSSIPIYCVGSEIIAVSDGTLADSTGRKLAPIHHIGPFHIYSSIDGASVFTSGKEDGLIFHLQR